MSTKTLHDRLKPLVVSIIEYAEPDRAADIILSLILSETVRTAAPPDPKRANKKTSGNGGNGARLLTHQPAATLDNIDPDREYDTKEAAALMEMNVGSFRAWCAVNLHAIDVIRRQPAQGGGYPRTYYLGSEILRARDVRNGIKTVGSGE